jgi:hypothetical protein
LYLNVHLELRDGIPLYYEVEGEGPSMCWFPDDADHALERQIVDLARDHRVVTFDLRGAAVRRDSTTLT